MQAITAKRVLMVVIAVFSMGLMVGCSGMEKRPKDRSGYLYYPTALVSADRALDEARNVGKDKECPAEFNVGEDMKMMLLSITEGDDKPLKYPLMFQESSALILNKIDLLQYTNVSIEKIKKDAMSLSPSIKIFEISCKTGEGISEWTDWLVKKVK